MGASEQSGFAGVGTPQDGEQLARFRDQSRRFITAAVVYTHTVAEQLGINTTDLHVLNLLAADGELSAGQLADATGLTSGAVTHVLTRLEAEGWIRRRPDPSDGRRVLVEKLPDPEAVRPLFKPLGMRMASVLMALPPAERDTVIGFFAACNPLLPEAASELRATVIAATAPQSRHCWRSRRRMP